MATHWPALVGIPMSAISAFCIVSLLRVTNGPIEFEGLGFKFQGASGPVVLWVVCFLALAAALTLLWARVETTPPVQKMTLHAAPGTRAGYYG